MTDLHLFLLHKPTGKRIRIAKGVRHLFGTTTDLQEFFAEAAEASPCTLSVDFALVYQDETEQSYCEHDPENDMANDCILVRPGRHEELKAND